MFPTGIWEPPGVFFKASGAWLHPQPAYFNCYAVTPGLAAPQVSAVLHAFRCNAAWLPQSRKLQEPLARVSQDNYKKVKSNNGHHSRTEDNHKVSNGSGICNKIEKSNESKPHALIALTLRNVTLRAGNKSEKKNAMFPSISNTQHFSFHQGCLIGK